MPFYNLNPVPEQFTPGVTLNATHVAASATAIDLIAANSDRKSLVIANYSEAKLYVNAGTATGAAASTTAHIRLIPPGTEYLWEPYEMPLGALNGIWDAASPSGSGQVIEGV